MEKQKFTYISLDSHAHIDTYELNIPLVDDGTPGSEHYLKLAVEVDGAVETLYVYHVGPAGMRGLGYFDVRDKIALANILYDAARLVTIQKFEPK